MKTQRIEEYVGQLLLLEGGNKPERTNYSELCEAFNSHRDSGYRDARFGVNGSEPTLFGLSLTNARRMWKNFYGIRGVEKMGADCLRRLTYTDWLHALQRACWFPLNCDKMPYQHLANMVADCCLFYGDDRVVLRQLLDILEHLRQLFAKPFDPLPPTEVITQQVTRRLSCQIRSTEVCNSVVRRLADLRIQFINAQGETDAKWAQHAAELIRRTERIARANIY